MDNNKTGIRHTHGLGGAVTVAHCLPLRINRGYQAAGATIVEKADVEHVYGSPPVQRRPVGFHRNGSPLRRPAAWTGDWTDRTVAAVPVVLVRGSRDTRGSTALGRQRCGR